MAVDKDSGAGVDFWASLGVDTGSDEPPDAASSQHTPEQGIPDQDIPDEGMSDEDIRVAGRTVTPYPPVAGEAKPDVTTSGSTGPTPAPRGDQAIGKGSQQAPAQQEAQSPARRNQRKQRGSLEGPMEISIRALQPADTPEPERARQVVAEGTAGNAPGRVGGPGTGLEPASHPTAPAWLAAERIAQSLRPRIPEIWAQMLTHYTNGDQQMALRVYHILNGLHLLGELWQDQSVQEVHIHGTYVTVCRTDGIHQVPGFPDLATAQRAIQTFKAAPTRKQALISHIGTAVIISRHPSTGPDTARLLAGGIITHEQLAHITKALHNLRAVTVTGPAARIVVRALSCLIPAGSRVYLGSYATLPTGCVTAATPMEADYILGVRPGPIAETMAANSQVGALIANPETPLPTAIKYAITGPSADPGKLTQLP
jgi:hypothetical protein